MNLDNLPVSWFDVVVVALLVLGIFRGRKRGMSQEFLDVIKWLVIVAAAAFLYEPLAQMLRGSVFGSVTSSIVAYVGIMVIVLSLFIWIKRGVGGKFIGSDAFGQAEYPLGMLSGMIRFACMIIVGLSVLNARLYTNAEVAAEVKYQNDNYGSQFFPTLPTMQAQIFKKSATGKWVKDSLSLLLIKPTAPEKKELRPDVPLP